MAIGGRAIGALSRPFEGGSGPGHTAITRIWTLEDALDYLPAEGSKADKVLWGLKALKDGVPAGPGQPELPPAPDKLQNVAVALADALVDYGSLVHEEAEALLAQPSSHPPEAPTEQADQAVPTPAGPPAPDVDPVDPSGPIFLVHGHDDGLLHLAVRVLVQGTGRQVIVLHEQANSGQTLLEKFESHAASAAYAVVLLTADDVGAARGDELSPRGRQNVIFELGFFFGKLGRHRVAVLLAPEVEQPSDITGIVYIDLDPAGAWKYQLARELTAAWIEVDLARIP